MVITRPREQADALAQGVRNHGGRAILFPAVEILEPDDPRALDDVVERLESFDWAIFISPVAAERAMKAIMSKAGLPPTLRLAAIGMGGVRALRAHGAGDIIAPSDRSDSEALLARSELQDVAGKRIVIFRGEGGRELLGDTLAARGATVEYALCYRRAAPSADPRPLLEAKARGELDAIVVTSSEGLRNLSAMLGAQAQEVLAETPLFVPHPRIAAAARQLALRCVIETPGGDEAMLAELIRHLGRPRA